MQKQKWWCFKFRGSFYAGDAGYCKNREEARQFVLDYINDGRKNKPDIKRLPIGTELWTSNGK